MNFSSLARHFAYIILVFNGVMASAQEPELMLPIGHNLPVKQLYISADNKYIVSRSEDHTVIIWENNTARIIRRIHAQQNGIVSVMFAGTDNSLITLYGNGKLTRTELVSGKKIFEETVSKPVNQVMIFGDQLILFHKKTFTSITDAVFGTTPDFNDIEIRKLASGKLVTSIKGKYPLDYHPGQKLLATANTEDGVTIYDENYQPRQKLSAGAPVLELKFFGNDIICVTADSAVKKLANAGKPYTLYKGTDKIKALTVLPDSNRVFGISYKKLLIISTADTAHNRQIGFRSSPEDIYLNMQSPHLLYFITENGNTGYINYTTGKGGFLPGQKAWNNRIVARNEKEFFTYGDDVFFTRWQPASFTNSLKFRGYTNPVEYINYDSASDRILLAVKGKTLMMRQGKTLAAIPTNLPAARPESISPLYADSLCILAFDKNNKLLFYDYKNASVFDSLHIPDDSLHEGYTTLFNTYQDAILVNESVTVQAISKRNTVIFWDADNNIISKSALLSVKGVTAGKQQRYFLVNANPALLFKKSDDGSQVALHAELPVAFEQVRFSNDENRIVFTETNKGHTISIYDIAKDQVVHSGSLHKYILSLSNANNRNIIAAATYDSLFLFNLDNASVIKKIPLHHGGSTAMHWKNDSILIVGNEDGVLSYLDVFTGKILLTHVIFQDGAHVVINPEKYYSGDRSKISLLHYVSPELRVIGFDQLDIQYNRPDLVLQSLGNTDTALLSSYRNAYLKRIKRLGIDTSVFKGTISVPEADFINRETIAFEQKNDKLTLHIHAQDKNYPLKHLNIWVNDVPMFGINGKDLGLKQTNAFDTVISVELSRGFNTIETSVINVAGMESYRIPLVVNNISTGEIPKERLYFIGIGIDQFADSTRNLKYCVKDIRDLALQLKKLHGDGIIIDTLFNKDVEKENIHKLKLRLQQTLVNDKVIVSYSGHGLLSKDYDYYLSTYSVNFDDPASAGLSYASFESLLDAIPARKKLLLIDACHSGEIDKEEMQKYERVRPALDKDTSKGKGIMPVIRKKKLGMKNSFELMQELFINVARSTGATVISAAAGTQFAIERRDLQNGVFTYCILEYLRGNSSATVNQLKDYLNARVPELTKGMQQPGARSETKYGDWNIWNNE